VSAIAHDPKRLWSEAHGIPPYQARDYVAYAQLVYPHIIWPGARIVCTEDQHERRITQGKCCATCRTGLMGETEDQPSYCMLRTFMDHGEERMIVVEPSNVCDRYEA